MTLNQKEPIQKKFLVTSKYLNYRQEKLILKSSHNGKRQKLSQNILYFLINYFLRINLRLPVMNLLMIVKCCV